MKQYTLLIVFFVCVLIPYSFHYSQTLSQRPLANLGPSKVTVSGAILNINDVNAANQVMTANIYFVVRWSDPRLVHQGPGNIIRPLDEIWNPKLIIVNRREGDITLPQTAEIQPDGTVIYRQRIFTELSQHLDYSDFPLDNQRFYIRLAAVGYGPEDVELTEDSTQKFIISEDHAIMEWKFQGVNTDNAPYSVTPGSKSVSSLSIYINAERKIYYYLFSFTVPLMLIILMSMSVFWIDPKLAASQINVSITSMLTLIAYRFMVAGVLPKIPYLTRMDIFIFCSTVIIFASLVESILTAGLEIKGKVDLANRMDFHCRWSFPLMYVIVFLLAFVKF